MNQIQRLWNFPRTCQTAKIFSRGSQPTRNKDNLNSFLVAGPPSCVFINSKKQTLKRSSVFGKTTHITVLAAMLVNKGTVLARPTCTARRLGHIDHVDISRTTWFWRRSCKKILCLSTSQDSLLEESHFQLF